MVNHLAFDFMSAALTWAASGYVWNRYLRMRQFDHKVHRLKVETLQAFTNLFMMLTGFFIALSLTAFFSPVLLTRSILLQPNLEPTSPVALPGVLPNAPGFPTNVPNYRYDASPIPPVNRNFEPSARATIAADEDSTFNPAAASSEGDMGGMNSRGKHRGTASPVLAGATVTETTPTAADSVKPTDTGNGKGKDDGKGKGGDGSPPPDPHGNKGGDPKQDGGNNNPPPPQQHNNNQAPSKEPAPSGGDSKNSAGNSSSLPLPAEVNTVPLPQPQPAELPPATLPTPQPAPQPPGKGNKNGGSKGNKNEQPGRVIMGV